jgi:hypothetical protein
VVDWEQDLKKKLWEQDFFKKKKTLGTGFETGNPCAVSLFALESLELYYWWMIF